MLTDETTALPQVEETELVFDGNEQLTKAVTGGTYYYIGNHVFVVFLLAEDQGFTVCWAKGDKSQSPMGPSFERYETFKNLEDAQATLAKLESIALDFFNDMAKSL